jgi:hypothetical protein
MAVRVALQCSDADAQTDPEQGQHRGAAAVAAGEAIYNDQNGWSKGTTRSSGVAGRERRASRCWKNIHQTRRRPLAAAAGVQREQAAALANNRGAAKQLAEPSPVKVPTAWLGDPWRSRSRRPPRSARKAGRTSCSSARARTRPARCSFSSMRAGRADPGDARYRARRHGRRRGRRRVFEKTRREAARTPPPRTAPGAAALANSRPS